jgi:uncharacterized MAPEG superfamily protein
VYGARTAERAGRRAAAAGRHVTIAYWCILAALLLPYIFSVLSRTGARKADYVRDPRSFNEQLSGWHRRSHLAQLNAFEAFPAFAVAVLIAHLAGVPQARLDLTAVIFIGFRVLHGVSYITDRASLRSASWQAGMICIIALFIFSGLETRGS